MSGLIALLDDVAAIAKLAAASVDDIAGQAAKAGAKAAGALIDDAAVTPRFVHGFAPARELPIVGKIALGSIRNKLLILLPLALALSHWAPWLIVPLLMLGGLYLCFEGAEKVWHALHPPAAHGFDHASPAPSDIAHLERSRVAGAIKTDFILSAEIMTIVLAALPPQPNLWTEAGALALAAIGITVLVYGSVALIVKADDLGLWLARNASLSVTRALGRGLVAAMPGFLRVLVVIGTAAMIWVGGSIIVHGLHALGWHAPQDIIAALAEQATTAIATVPPIVADALSWAVTALCDGILGLALGLAVLAMMAGVVEPLKRALRRARTTNDRSTGNRTTKA